MSGLGQPGAQFDAAIRAAVRDEINRQGQSAMRARAHHAKVQLGHITKFVSSAGARVLRGRCSAPTMDRDGDIVESNAGHWKLPLPVLFAHDHKSPIGVVRKIERRADGLWVECEIAAGIAKADEVWALIAAGAIADYSIGFIGTKSEALPSGGRRFTSWELVEISVCAVGSNRDAKIERSAGLARNHGSIRLIDNRGSVPLVKVTR